MRYYNVYFRLKPKNCHKFKGEETKQFYDEITGLFKSAGWNVEIPSGAGRCPEVFFDKTNLYLHPKAASGPVAKDLVEKVERILRDGKTFHCYKTDIIGELQDWSDDEYIEYLKSKEQDIRTVRERLCP